MTTDATSSGDGRIPFENDHNVYVLGAGFSCHAGLPLMSNFLQVMREAHPWLVQTGRKRSAESIERVLEFRLRAAAASYRINIDVENVEHLFSLASSVDDIRLADAVPVALCTTLDFAHQTHRGEGKPISFSRDGTTAYPPSWREPPGPGEVGPNVIYPGPVAQVMLGRMLGWNAHGTTGRNTVVTFNYDTIVEDGLNGLGVPFDYALGPTDSPDSVRPPAPVPLLKLHGSTNWALNREVQDRVDVCGSLHDIVESDRSPLVIPPTWRKVFPGALASVWSRATEALRTATRIVLVGFSIPETDLHFKYLLASALIENISLRSVTVVAPDTTSPLMVGRLSSLFRDPSIVSRFPMTAETYFGGSTPDPRLGRTTPWRTHPSFDPSPPKAAP